MLVVDEASLSSITNFQHGTGPFIWAVDVSYNPATQAKYPSGYKGYFKVHYMAPIHELFPPIASYFITPVDLWSLLQLDSADKKDLINSVIETRVNQARHSSMYKKAGSPSKGGRETQPRKDEL